MHILSQTHSPLPLPPSSLLLLFLLLMTASIASAQIPFFENFFQGGGGGGHQHHQQQQQREQNVASDSEWYQRTSDGAHCTNYLCPGTLSCVAFPHHCPCAWPALEDKVELGEGTAVCASKGGWKTGEMQRKVELARMGKL